MILFNLILDNCGFRKCIHPQLQFVIGIIGMQNRYILRQCFYIFIFDICDLIEAFETQIIQARLDFINDFSLVMCCHNTSRFTCAYTKMDTNVSKSFLMIYYNILIRICQTKYTIYFFVLNYI